jgi:hypothetical protein
MSETNHHCSSQCLVRPFLVSDVDVLSSLHPVFHSEIISADPRNVVTSIGIMLCLQGQNHSLVDCLHSYIDWLVEVFSTIPLSAFRN